MCVCVCVCVCVCELVALVLLLTLLAGFLDWLEEWCGKDQLHSRALSVYPKKNSSFTRVN